MQAFAHNAPVMDCRSQWCGKPRDIHTGLAELRAGGIPAAKIVLGLATYGRTFKLVDPSADIVPGFTPVNGKHFPPFSRPP